MTLKQTGHRNILFIIIGIVAGLFLVYVAYVLFLRNAEHEIDQLTVSEKKSESEVRMITVPFKAEFAAHYVATYEDINRCGELPWKRIIVEGTSTETTLGKINIFMDFCSQGGTGVYFDMIGSFITAEGDSLFINTWGQVRQPDEDDPPYYINKWEDPFEFTGGTGRFEGATGGGMTHCYNSTEDDLNHHNWEGTLTMKEE